MRAPSATVSTVAIAQRPPFQGGLKKKNVILSPTLTPLPPAPAQLAQQLPSACILNCCLQEILKGRRLRAVAVALLHGHALARAEAK